MNVILFSPIGTSDPTNGNYDGPMLHIVRNYQPQKLVIFLTNEMAEIDERDNRNTLLAQHVKPDIIIEKKIHKEIEKPNDFQLFDGIFKKYLNEIHSAYPNSQIIINVSSGTPQIIASLYMLATSLSFPVKLIQVNSPAKASNKTKSDPKSYQVSNELKNLIDDLQDEEIQNRCAEIIPKNVIELQLRRAVENHVTAYDYHAAKETINMAPGLFNSEVKYLIDMASYRAQLNHREADKIANRYAVDIYPLKSGEVKNIFEYIVYLHKIQKKGFLNDFSRALSPIMLNLFHNIIYEKGGIDVKERYCEDRKHKGFYLLEVKLKEDADVYKYYENSEFLDGKFKDNALAPSHLLPYLNYLKDINKIDTKVFEQCKTLREIEKRVRNSAAHEINYIDDRIFKQKVNITSGETLQIIKELFEYAYNKKYKNQIDWNSYDKMNFEIIKRVRQS